jgi:hypothetical protein
VGQVCFTFSTHIKGFFPRQGLQGMYPKAFHNDPSGEPYGLPELIPRKGTEEYSIQEPPELCGVFPGIRHLSLTVMGIGKDNFLPAYLQLPRPAFFPIGSCRLIHGSFSVRRRNRYACMFSDFRSIISAVVSYLLGGLSIQSLGNKNGQTSGYAYHAP